MNIFKEIAQNRNLSISRPFWSWNDKLEKEELKNQIDKMKESGIDGFFMHARGGLKTEYMSEDWFSAINECINYADQKGMEAWAYDENGWPSGFADGKVPLKSDEYKQKWLTLSVLEENQDFPENMLCAFVENGDGFCLAETPKKGVSCISVSVNPYYIDAFNKETIKYFIKVTHEEYYKRFENDFGTKLKGFFTDEPQYKNRPDHPWSHTFIEEFKNRYGLDLIPNLPRLYLKGNQNNKFRYDFFSMAADLFESSFMKQIYDWCNEHSCKLTGHMMGEPSLYSQLNSTGGVMPCYEYFHIPGVDWLGRKIFSPLLPKQLGSVCEQLGKPNLTETFALCGWDVSFNELKWIAQWQFVNGVNSLCQHLEGYSIKGLRKRDYPASLFTQASYFGKPYKYFNDYFVNLGALLKCGQEVSQTLVIHPIKNTYLYGSYSGLSEIAKLENLFTAVTTGLNNLHIPHHYGDETVMKKYGSAENGKLVIGKMEYEYVIIPGLKTITENTAKLLIAFAKQGGKIYCYDQIPTLIDGEENELVNELKAYAAPLSFEKLKTEICGLCSPSICLEDAECDDVHCRIRKLGDGSFIYYLVNNTEKEFTATLKLPKGYKPLSVDIINQTKTELYSKASDYTLNFAKYGDCVLHIVKGENQADFCDKQTEYISLKPMFDITNCPKNSLTLDKCRYRVDSGAWQKETPVIKIQSELLKLYKTCKVDLEFKFTVDDIIAATDLELVMESPSEFSIKINGSPLDFTDNGYFVDKSFRKTVIADFVKKGENTVLLSTEFKQNPNVYRVLSTPGIHEAEINKLTYDSELESIYLLGDFSVKEHFDYTLGDRKCIFGKEGFSLTLPKTQVDIRNITTQGYWFFTGVMELSQTVNISKNDNKYFIKLKDLKCPVAEVYVNGNDAGILSFAPYETDITDYVVNGENKITIKLYASNRNLLGPHHKPIGELHSVVPASFTDKRTADDGDSAWTDNYNFVEFGIEI